MGLILSKVCANIGCLRSDYRLVTDEEILKVISKDYTFLEVLWRGVHAKVVKCVKKETGEEVAIKVMYSCKEYQEEVKILEKMKDAGLDGAHTVKFLERIETRRVKGLVFECLDMTLFTYMKKVFPLPLCDVRAIIKQMAVALGTLETFGCLHTDVKPDNIMLRVTSRPLQAKLIDFGLVMPLSEAQQGVPASLVMYRAPEVLLGCPYNNVMDVWALGVSISNLMMNTALFPDDSEYAAIRAVVSLLGQPPDELLNQGRLTRKFFKKCGESWILKTKEQYAKDYSVDQTPGHFTEQFPSLRSVIKTIYDSRGEDLQELDCFIDLLERMLDVNNATRIRAAEIGNHPFITNYRECGIEPFTAEEVQVFLREKYTVVNMQGVDNLYHQMVKCKTKDTGKFVSVKISYNERDTCKEACLLKRMMRRGLEKQNIAMYLKSVDFGSSKALVFEELDRSLNDYLQIQRKIPIMEVRTIAQQAATALTALQDLKIIHTNLSMNSFWFSDIRPNHTKIKLVDFSSAMYSRDIQEGMILRSQYRAPEMILGLPITEAVDVWSLGNIFSTVLMGFNVFPEQNDFGTLKVMVALFGNPPDNILNAGTHVKYFFKKTAGRWRLMTDKEYAASQGLNLNDIRTHDTERFESLKNLIYKKVNGGMHGTLYHDDCVDLLSQMFQVDPAKRILPRQIQEHRFFQEESFDSEDEEEEENEPQPPPQVQAARPKDTPRVPCITEMWRVEHELVPPETVQVFPDRIDNTLLTLHCTNNVTLDERIPLAHTAPRFHRFQPYGSDLPGMEPCISKKSATENNSCNSSDNIQTTTQSASTYGGSKSQSTSRSSGSKSQSTSRSSGSKSQSTSRSSGSKSQSTSRSSGSKSQSTLRSGESKSQSASTYGGSKSQSTSRSGESKTQSASRSGESKSQSASTYGGSKSQSTSRSGESKTQSTSRSSGSKSQSTSTSSGSKSQSTSRSSGSKSQSTSRSSGSKSQSTSRSSGSKSQSTSRSSGSKSQSTSTSSGSKSQSTSRSSGSKSQSTSTSSGSKSQSTSTSSGSKSASMSGKSEDVSSGDNEEEEEEEKKKKKKKKKNCLRRVWSWVKKHLSCCHTMDDDDVLRSHLD